MARFPAFVNPSPRQVGLWNDSKNVNCHNMQQHFGFAMYCATKTYRKVQEYGEAAALPTAAIRSDNRYSDISKWVMQWVRVRVRIRVTVTVRVRVSVSCAFSEAFVGIAAVGIAAYPGMWREGVTRNPKTVQRHKI